MAEDDTPRLSKDDVWAMFQESTKRHQQTIIDQFDDISGDAEVAAEPVKEPVGDAADPEAGSAPKEPKRRPRVAKEPATRGVLQLARKESGAVMNTIGNLHALLKHHGAVVSVNRMTKTMEIEWPGQSPVALTNRLNVRNAEVVSLCNEAGLSASNVNAYLLAISERNPYHPAVLWVESKPWDGVDRLTQLKQTITTSASDELRDILVEKWLTGAIAALYHEEGVALDGVLTFQGPQGSGKTRWLRALAPKGMVADGVWLDTKDKDSVFKCMMHWIVELGEVDATFRRSDIASLKSFLVQDTDLMRRPYAPAESWFARQTTFTATVNEAEFLHDATGNRRFWVLPNAHLNWQHGIDMQQLWAQVREDYYLMGARWHLNDTEMALLNASNLLSTATSNDPMDDPWYDRLAACAVERAGESFPLSQILATDLLLPEAHQTPVHTKRAVRILKAIGAVRKHTMLGKRWEYPVVKE